jgi:hypothetical protein
MHRHSRTFGDPVATNGLNGAFGRLPDPPSLFEGADRQNPASAGFCFACHQDCSPMREAAMAALAKSGGANDCRRLVVQEGLIGGHYWPRRRRR